MMNTAQNKNKNKVSTENQIGFGNILIIGNVLKHFREEIGINA